MIGLHCSVVVLVEYGRLSACQDLGLWPRPTRGNMWKVEFQGSGAHTQHISLCSELIQGLHLRRTERLGTYLTRYYGCIPEYMYPPAAWARWSPRLKAKVAGGMRPLPVTL